VAAGLTLPNCSAVPLFHCPIGGTKWNKWNRYCPSCILKNSEKYSEIIDIVTENE
jgi:hypothetical protein